MKRNTTPAKSPTPPAREVPLAKVSGAGAEVLNNPLYQPVGSSGNNPLSK